MVRRNVAGVNAQSLSRGPCVSGRVAGFFLGRPLGRFATSLTLPDAGGGPLSDATIGIFGASWCSVRGRPLPPLPLSPLALPLPRPPLSRPLARDLPRPLARRSPLVPSERGLPLPLLRASGGRLASGPSLSASVRASLNSGSVGKCVLMNRSRCASLLVLASR